MHADIPPLSRNNLRMAWRLRALYLGQEATSRQKRAAAFALRYYISPWDLIPDALPGVGLLDDYAVLYLAVAWLDPPEVEPPEDQTRAELMRSIEEAIRGEARRTTVVD